MMKELNIKTKKTTNQSSEEIFIRKSENISDSIYLVNNDLSSDSGDFVNVFENGTKKDNKPVVTEEARSFLINLTYQKQAQQIFPILDKIDFIVANYSDIKFQNLSIAQAEDETIGVTWKIYDATLGMSFSINAEDSSWFLLIGKDNRGVTAFGNFNYFDDHGLLLSWLVYLLERLRRKGEQK